MENAEQSPESSYHMFFNINKSIFESFLLKFGRTVKYEYKNDLLKVSVPDPQNQENMIAVINEITGNNGVLVWCFNKELL